MPANVDGMVREGISAYRAGKKDEARAFLLKAVEIDERNEQAWLWLSAVVDSAEEQQICLENVLAINPNNERARQGIQMLKQKSLPPSPSPARAEDVLASVSFTPPPAPPKPAPAPVSPFKAEAEPEELPSTIEWDEPATATSSASTTRKVNEPSPAEYDDWVSGLNLGGKSPPALFDEPDVPEPTPAKTNLEDVQKFMTAPAFDDEDEDDLFGIDADARIPDDLFNSGPFSAPETAVPPAPKPREEKKPPPAPKPTPARPAAPARADSLLDAMEDEEFISEFDEFDEVTLEAPDPTEMFHHIPKEIKATRLPGTRERYPILVLLGFVIAIAANVGAVAFLVYRLTSG
ncbi:MAG: tetratricopeptide repeat protein [Chloroflexi bacterium]|nr:tetratricopeptide repeat protein [Chloroflexota bacterium]